MRRGFAHLRPPRACTLQSSAEEKDERLCGRAKLREEVQQPQGALTNAFSFNVQNSHKLCILLMNINIFVLNTNVFLSKSLSKRGIPAFWSSPKQNPFYLGTKPTLLQLPKAVWTCRRQVHKGTDTSYYISATTLRSELNAS